MLIYIIKRMSTLHPIIISIMSNTARDKDNNTLKGTSKDVAKSMPNECQMVCIHLVDGIYQGMVNSSYQRDGLGILQTESFDTYIGYFKYNRIHGLGLIVYLDGSIVYGHFVNGQMEGIALTDNSHQLQVGLFSNAGMVGIGFEYSVQKQVWKMNRYHRGVSIETLNQETVQEGELPEMLNLEPEILKHYIQYKTKRLFPNSLGKDNTQQIKEDINQVYFHELPNQGTFFGATLDSKYEGLGVVYDGLSKTVSEAGTYYEGKLHGYGIKIEKSYSREELGCYDRGAKRGLFKEKFGTTTKFVVFGRSSQEEKPDLNIEHLKKQRRLYHYRQKDFMSLRHLTHLEQFKAAFESGVYRARQLQQEADTQQHKDQNKSIPKSKPKPKPASRDNNIGGGLSSYEKASLAIMKQKIASFSGKKAGSQGGKADSKKVSIKIVEKQDGKKQSAEYSEDSSDQIAKEESPIDTRPNLTARKLTYNFGIQRHS